MYTIVEVMTMMVNTNAMVSISEANQNFSKSVMKWDRAFKKNCINVLTQYNKRRIL